MKHMDDGFTIDDLSELRLMLSSIDEKIQLPENLKGKNLLHLLPDEEPKPVFNLWNWLTSRNALPMYSVVAVAVLALMVVPNLSVGSGKIPMEIAQDPLENSSDESVEQESEAITEEESVASEESQDKASTSEVKMGGGSDEKDLDYRDNYNDGDDLQDPEEPEAEMPGRLGGDSPAKAENAENDSQSATVPKAGDSKPLEDEPPKVPEPPLADEPPAIRAFGGVLPADSSYYITDSGGYSFYWRSADTTKSEESEFAIILEVKLNDADENIYASRGLTHFHRVDNVSVADNRVAVFGSGEQGLGITILQGIKNANLKQEKTEYLSGTLVGQHGANSHLYIFTSFTDSTQVPAATGLVLPKSNGQGAFMITITDTAKGTFSKVAITGVPPMASYTFDTAEKIKVFYADTDGVETSAVFQVNGTEVTLVTK